MTTSQLQTGLQRALETLEKALEQGRGGTLYRMDLATEQVSAVDVQVVTDLATLRPRNENVFVPSVSSSPCANSAGARPPAEPPMPMLRLTAFVPDTDELTGSSSQPTRAVRNTSATTALQRLTAAKLPLFRFTSLLLRMVSVLE